MTLTTVYLKNKNFKKILDLSHTVDVLFFISDKNKDIHMQKGT